LIDADRRTGETPGQRVEVKNVPRLTFITRAIEYEIERQVSSAQLSSAHVYLLLCFFLRARPSHAPRHTTDCSQIAALTAGEKIERETRVFDAAQGVTHRLRSKEQMLDYRFFPEPNLPPLLLTVHPPTLRCIRAVIRR
jgi:Asp-tRNA(Asn)/Glu-tRNA(Gln) amidotransferase B subunit